MAQGKKRRAAQQRKTASSRKTRGRVAATARKLAKRTSAKAAPRKKSAKAKTKRIVAKLTKSKATAQRKKPIELPIEVVRVEQIDEATPGVVVVSEVESVQVGPVAVTNVPGEAK